MHIKHKLKAALALSMFQLFNLSTLKADEGMWTLYDLPQATLETMAAEGFKLSFDELYTGPTALKAAVVNFSGYCSGVVVSPDGLVFTNHHCGFEAIRSHSTVEHDYMLNGFSAKSYSEELPNEDMFVSFMISQDDITRQVMAAGYDNMSTDRREELIDSLQNVLNKQAKAKDSTYHVEVDPFFEGNQWIATTYQKFTDLRLVFTVPKSMGKFGGETDNWMWPRQTCDFSVFRIYADPKTNGPADYSEANVPYKPQRWAQVSLDGYKDGDYSMTIGYPGSTSRYLSSFGIRERRDAINAPRAQVRGVKQEVMWRHMTQDEAVRIKYDSKYATSSNYWKNSIGMNKCIDSIDIIGQKQRYEARIKQYVDSTGRFADKLNFATLERLYGKSLEASYAWTNFTESFFRNNELATRALRLSMGMEVKGPKDKPKKQYVEFKDNSDTWDLALDREVMGVMLENYRQHVDKKYWPAFYTRVIDAQFGGDCKAYADALYSRSILMHSGEKLYINSKKYKNDLGVSFGLDLMEVFGDLRTALSEVSDSIDEQERWLCAAKVRMEEDMPHYSDANFTMRLSYGQVGGFELAGQPSGYYTTAESLAAKMKRAATVADYQAEPEMLSLMESGDFSPYADRETGKMQLCFLTNNDITGGNSGSPMFDGNGRLIGLAFDGNWDSLSSDINFDHRLARCIGVDIRYVLLMMDRWGHADRLLREMGVAGK